MTNKPATVYCLRDPRTDAIRYVGITGKQPFTRRWDAWRSYAHRANNALADWLLDLIAAGVEPIREALEVTDTTDGPNAERRWIRDLIRDGVSLCNLSPGGDIGGLGSDGRRRPLTEEHRAAISAALRRGQHDAWNKGTTRPPEEYATRRGRVQSPEERAARSHEAWNKGTGKPKPTCADCGAPLRDSRSRRCKRCAAVAREGGVAMYRCGHPKTPENSLRSGSRGGRTCRTCHNARRRLSR